jgi:hypothetical protein
MNAVTRDKLASSVHREAEVHSIMLTMLLCCHYTTELKLLQGFLGMGIAAALLVYMSPNQHESRPAITIMHCAVTACAGQWAA